MHLFCMIAACVIIHEEYHRISNKQCSIKLQTKSPMHTILSLFLKVVLVFVTFVLRRFFFFITFVVGDIYLEG